MQISSDKRFGQVNLEEHHYDFFPPVINKSFEMISENEKASLLFPDVLVPLKITTEVVAEDIESIDITRKSEALIDDDLLARIKESYEKLYQSTIKYNFSEYKVNFTVNLKYDKYKKIGEVGECYVEEEVLNNLENICSYNLKRVKT